MVEELSLAGTSVGNEPAKDIATDNEGQIATLVRSLRMQRGFGLYFVSIRQSDQRRQFLNDLRDRLPAFSLQEVFLRKPESHLLGRLRETLAKLPPSDLRPLLCVYGIENWLGGVEGVESSAFVADLNATRNAFAATLNCPVLFCVPEHVLVGINRGAPDFFSVRSGVYFLDSPSESRLLPTAETLEVTGLHSALGAGIEGRHRQAVEWEELLNGYSALAPEKRDPVAEINALHNLATVHYASADYALARPLLERALEISENYFGINHRQTSVRLNNLASLYRRINKKNNAILLYERALSIEEKTPNESDTSVPTTLNNIASLYEDMGNYDKAIPLFEQALSSAESTLGDNHPQTGMIVNNIAVLYRNQGQYNRAIIWFKKSLSITEAHFGPNHPYTATIINNLAGVYKTLGDYAHSLPLFKRAINISQNVLGDSHPQTLTFQGNLASLYSAMLISASTQSSNKLFSSNSQHTLRPIWEGSHFDAQGRLRNAPKKRKKKR